MDELQRILDGTPGTLADQLVEVEQDDGGDGNEEDPPLSLYQPAHECYYLVTASLVCQERGLPDRAVKTTQQQRTAFVLRRLDSAPDDDDDETREYGWTGTAWKPVANPTAVANAEEPLKMFPKRYAPQAPVAQMKGGRRMWAGLIPTGKRDTYETAPVHHDDIIRRANGEEEEEGNGETNKEGVPKSWEKEETLLDPRKTKFAARVIGAFEGVNDVLEKEKSTVTAADVRDPLVFAWLDLWQFLGTHFDGLQDTIIAGDRIDSDDSDVLRVLNAITLSDFTTDESGEETEVAGVEKWDTALDPLRSVDAHESDVERGQPDDVLEPNELPQTGGELAYSDLRAVLAQILAPEVGIFGNDNDTPALQEVVQNELGSLDDIGQLPEDLKPPATDPSGGGEYVVRCVYERPNCPPQRRMLVSRPSKTFQLASFFDADAPARDINITLPSSALADLRDSSQNVSLVFTKELRRQAERVQDITLSQLQDGKVGEAPTVNIGMICSLSIPIITICALVLLLIIVVLLNIVFWWLPFFKICFPLPTND